MRNHFRQLTVVFLFMMILMSFIPNVAFAASYETVKDNVPIWSEPDSSSSQVKTISNSGTILSVVASTTNVHGNLWYKLSDGNWVYSGNVKVHKHVACMCGRSKTFYEQNNSSTHFKVVYSGDELCSCGQIMGPGSTTRTTEPHSFNSEDMCTVCDYKRAHVHAGASCGRDKTTYEQGDSSNHIIVFDRGDEYCLCGAVVKENPVTRTPEAHSFDSNNTCTICGKHVHKGASCGRDNITIEQGDSSNHIIVNDRGDEYCLCGAVVKENPVTRTSEPHSFDSEDKCTVCGYKRAHVHSGASCGRDNTTYEQGDSSNHIIVFDRGDEYCLCGALVKENPATRTSEPHSFNSEDKCIVCGYKKAHVHKGASCGRDNTTYEQGDSSNHIIVFDRGDEYCLCGTVVKENPATRTSEPHSFGSDDKCTVCGYKREHVHNVAWWGDDRTTYEQGDSSSHIKVYSRGEGYCSCGTIVEERNVTQTPEAHSFDSDGKCTVCGYNKVHKHKGASCGRDNTIYEQGDSFTHIKVYDKGDEYCSCGAVVKENPVTRTPELHNFDSDGKCTLCGYKKPHEHKGVKCLRDKSTYEQIDASNHIKIYDQGDEVCSCGAVVKEYPVKRITESHTFVNDKCTGCGYTREHVHEASIVEEPSTVYELKDGSNHVVVKYGGYKQCSCGYVILMRETTRTYEKHSYVVGNVCSKCGYVSTGGALNQVLEEAVEGNFSDNSSLWGIAGQIIVGEIPGVGTAADVRDCLADISNWESSWGHAGETILDCSGLIPIIGAVKYVDDIAAVASKTDDVAAVVNKADDIGAIIHKADDVIGSTINKTDDISSLFKNSDEIDEILAKVDPDSLGLIRRPSKTLESFNNYDAFKREFGSAGKGMEWHHIVGQTQINRADFITSNMVNSTDNIIALDKKTHEAITTMYNKLVPGTKMKYYEWLAEQPFEIQYEYGLEALEDALRETGKIK